MKALYVGFCACVLVACGSEDGGSPSSGSGGAGAGIGSGTSAQGGAAGNGSAAGGSGASSGALSDPDYREGFGKNATGGVGRTTYVVTSSAETGAGSFYGAFQPGDSASDKIIVFEVDTVTLPGPVYIGSNVTIDGVANGMNGVTLDASADQERGLIIEDPASNIVIRGINFRSNGTPNSGVAEFDLLAMDGTNGGSISNVLVDRCTFVQASDGALDITGDVSNVTVQRSLFYGMAKAMLIKYDSRQNISLHHNVFTRNGERNPQVKGDMQLIDFVNNVVHENDVPSYTDGSSTSPYGVRCWSGNSGSDSPGNVVGNFVANAFLGDGAQFELSEDSGASLSQVFIGDNLCSPSSNCPSSPAASANAIPPEFAVTTLPTDQLGALLLPYVGAPNRAPLDQERIDAVAAAL
jgi:pectate lyase